MNDLSAGRHAYWAKSAAGLVAVVMSLYHMWVIWAGAPEAHVFRALHLLFALVLVFLMVRARSGTEDEIAMSGGGERAAAPPSLLDYALLGLLLVPFLHLFWNFGYFINRIYYVDDLSWLDIASALILIAVVVEASRRLMGWALPLTALAALAFALIFARTEPMRLLDQLYMTVEGIFGIPISVSAQYVIVFVLFGSFMERTGTGQLFMDFAMSLTGSTAGGPGKVSVVSSSLFGTISGSAVANVMVDGPISIPLMKRSGFPAHFAAGIEAVASTGGQIMPPIMGAAAFVMAEMLHVGYGQVVIWAIIPATLYYVACFAAVHFEAKRRGLVGVPRSELPRMSQVLAERGHLFLPILIILLVMNMGYSSPLAALFGTLACFPVAALRKTTRSSVSLANLIAALIDGAKNTLAVALACACAGIVIGVVTLTGVGVTFTQLVVNLAKDTLFIALLLTMAAGIVLGMGMPTTPAYIIMTSLLIPAVIALVKASGLNVVPGTDPDLNAKAMSHMFAFYFAIISAITPPVALAVYAAAGLAKSDLWQSGWAAMRIGAAGFVVPFMFIYEPALLMIGPWHLIVLAFGTATLGCVLLAAGLHGCWRAPLTGIESAAMVVAGLCLAYPWIITDLVGLAIAAAIWLKQSRSAAAPVSAREGAS